ncbi:MAG: hypothetical protein JW976_13960 [Syntrophaceae bacterium]|nr:hypothetical protein [Syntrophaceae bacterium]
MPHHIEPIGLGQLLCFISRDRGKTYWLSAQTAFDFDYLKYYRACDFIYYLVGTAVKLKLMRN